VVPVERYRHTPVSSSCLWNTRRGSLARNSSSSYSWRRSSRCLPARLTAWAAVSIVNEPIRAFSGDANYAAVAHIAETVEAGVQLSVTPTQTGPEGMIVLSGTVEGAIPQQGAIVNLLVHYRGRWEPFRTPRTNERGRFRVVYQFEGGVGRFPFRAEVPGGQAGFPFGSGDSQVVDVSTK